MIVCVGILIGGLNNINLLDTDDGWLRLSLHGNNTGTLPGNLPTGVTVVNGSSLVGVPLRKTPAGYVNGQGVIMIDNNSGTTQTLYLWNGTSEIDANITTYVNFFPSAGENYLYAIPMQ